jgi:hypothetical protein
MDTFVEKRSFLASNVETILENISSRREANKIDTDDLFGDDETLTGSKITWKKSPKNRTKLELLMMEKEALGLYVSGNPLVDYQNLQTWVQTQTNDDDIHLVIVEKIKKIFTKQNQMMLGLMITTPEESLEGIVFPKRALALSSILQEKSMFWVKGKIEEPKQKKKPVPEKVEKSESEEGDVPEVMESEVKEYVESKKLLVDWLCRFEDGVIKIFEELELPLSNTRKEIIRDVDWSAVFEDPTEIIKLSDHKHTPISQASVREVTLRLDKKFPLAKIKEIKSKLSKEPKDGYLKVILEVEHLGEFKKVNGDHWIEESYYYQLIK